MMSFNDLYLDYKDEEIEIRMALQSVINDERVISEAVHYYQTGKAQDLIYAEQALARGLPMDRVNGIIKGRVQNRKDARPSWDVKLRNALIKAKRLPDTIRDYEAHHIVAKGAKRARFAIEILESLGIDIDDIVNGVFLPANEEARTGKLSKAYIHNNIHTNQYYANVNYLIVSEFQKNEEASDDELRAIIAKKLGEIAEQLRRGKFPISYYLPGSEAYQM